MKQFCSSDIDKSVLVGQMVAIVGYGSQGRAQALNLRDSGLHVVVAARKLTSESALTAKADGFEVMSLAPATQNATLIMILTPDETHADVYREISEQVNLAGKSVGFAHGYAYTYDKLQRGTDSDVILISPKGIGPAVRSQYLAGSGVAALVAVAKDATGLALKRALAYAAAIGSDRVGIFETTFEEETTADLFSEQAVIVGGMTSLIKSGFDTMVKNGIAPEIAYFECVVEAKLILDMIVEHGFADMFDKISNTAEYGAYTAGPVLVDDASRERLDKIFQEIKSGEFAKAWDAEVAHGMPSMDEFRQQWQDSQINQITTKMRKTP